MVPVIINDSWPDRYIIDGFKKEGMALKMPVTEMKGFLTGQLVAGFQLKFADGTIQACGQIYKCEETHWEVVRGAIIGIKWALTTYGQDNHEPKDFGFVLGDIC